MVQNKFNLISSKPIRNTLKGGDKTRDILYVEGKYKNNKLHIFVNHWPSNYGGREKAIPKRFETANLVMDVIKKIQNKDKFADIIFFPFSFFYTSQAFFELPKNHQKYLSPPMQ